MTRHIDLGSVLRGTVSEQFTNLVTRPTGHAVRGAIEALLGDATDAVTVIDFTHVGLLDYSCADEIIAKLLQRYDAREPADAPGAVYFVFRGLNELHIESIEWVLNHHGLALVAEEEDGEPHLIGAVDEEARTVWSVVGKIGACSALVVAEQAGLEPGRAERTLVDLWRRRLLRRENDQFLAARVAS
ncbi:MAG: hypothetical protein HY275_11345 [Gemmatimonadetes bacterium]|nr:hypothetical protein [Gemmatimonadota bacterium]